MNKYIKYLLSFKYLSFVGVLVYSAIPTISWFFISLLWFVFFGDWNERLHEPPTAIKIFIVMIVYSIFHLICAVLKENVDEN